MLKNKILWAAAVFMFLEGLVLSYSSSARAAISWQQAKNVWLQVQNEGRVHVALKYDSGLYINAYSDVRSIYVTQGLLNFVTSEGELGAVLGHELSHVKYGDARHRESNKQFELRGDREGYQICKKLNYKKCKSFMYKMKAKFGEEGDDGEHPTWSVRIKGLEEN